MTSQEYSNQILKRREELGKNSRLYFAKPITITIEKNYYVCYVFYYCTIKYTNNVYHGYIVDKLDRCGFDAHSTFSVCTPFKNSIRSLRTSNECLTLAKCYT